MRRLPFIKTVESVALVSKMSERTAVRGTDLGNQGTQK
jgi:hypothetical protein